MQLHLPTIGKYHQINKFKYMKKLSLFLIAFILIVSACKKEDKKVEPIIYNPINNDLDRTLEPTDIQNGFAINYTATWCGPCGDRGAPIIQGYANDAPKGAIITAHIEGDPMINSLVSSFKTDRTYSGTPTFWVGDTKTSNSGAISSLIDNANANAGIDYSYTISENTMTIKTKTKFFSSFTGDAYLSILVLEDGINGNSSAGQYEQSGTSSSYPDDNYFHNYVLRNSSIKGNSYGEKIASTPLKNIEVEKTYTITIDPNWKNVYPIAIVWEYIPGAKPEYKYINSYKF